MASVWRSSENEKKKGEGRRIHRKTKEHARVVATSRQELYYRSVAVVLPRLDDNYHV